MANDASALVVAGNGSVSVAPYGTALPTTRVETLNAAFVDLGLVTEDGLSFSNEPETTDFMAWQLLDPARTELTSRARSVSAAFEEWKEDTLITAFGGGEVEDLGSGEYKYTFLTAQDSLQETAVVVDWNDGDNAWRWVFPRCVVTDSVETTLSRGDLATLPITFKVLGGEGDEVEWYTNAEAFGPPS